MLVVVDSGGMVHIFFFNQVHFVLAADLVCNSHSRIHTVLTEIVTALHCEIWWGVLLLTQIPMHINLASEINCKEACLFFRQDLLVYISP